MAIDDLTETECAYIAGYVDGDGGFYSYCLPYVSKKTGKNLFTFQNYIRFSSTDLCAIEWVGEKVGFTAYYQQKPVKGRPYERIVYNLQITGKKLDALIVRLIPYLIIKKQNAILVMKIRETYQIKYGSQGVPQHIADKRHELHKQLRQITSRFHNHPIKKS